MRVFLLAVALVLATSGMARATGYQDFDLGIAAADRDDHDAAVQSLTRALAAPDFPEHLRPPALLARGEAYYFKKQYVAAIADYMAAIKLKPNYPEAFVERASAYTAAHRYAEAIADDSWLVQADPYNLTFYLNRLLLYEETKQYAEGIADCNTILSLWPNIPVDLKLTPKAGIYWFRANFHLSLGQFDQTIADDSTAIDLNDKMAAAYVDRGLAKLLRGAFDDAHSDFDDALDHSDNNAATRGSVIGGVDVNVQTDASTINWYMGFDEWDMGRFEQASKAFAKALKLSPKNTAAVLGLAISSARSGAAEDIATDGTAVDLAAWPGPLLAFWLGKSNADQLRAAAAKGEPGDIARQRCQVDFYLGEWQMAHQDAASARVSLGASGADCPPDAIEREAAQIELGRAQIAGQKP